jgi:fucose permease
MIEKARTMTKAVPQPVATGRFAAGLCVYLGGLVIGLTLVSFPASSLILRAAHGFSNEQYGAIYIPQLATSVIGALLGGAVARRLSLKGMFLFALACFALAELLLSLSIYAAPNPALAMIMVGTGAFGFGFGFGGGPLNAFAALLFPRRQGAAVTALHMCAGAGLTIAPVYFALLAEHGAWIVGPGSLAVVSTLLFAIALATQFPAPVIDDTASDLPPARHPGLTLFFWICALASLLYSVAEGTFSNWAIVFLTEERGLNAGNAALALTCFWASLTVGRLIATLIATKVPPIIFLLALPLGMMASLLFLPKIDSVDTAYIGFALAGLSCSAFFPMLVAFTAERSPTAISWIASMLTAAMMVGVGIGSYAVGALRGGMPIAALYGQAIIAPLLCLLCIGAGLVLIRARRSPA